MNRASKCSVSKVQKWPFWFRGALAIIQPLKGSCSGKGGSSWKSPVFLSSFYWHISLMFGIRKGKHILYIEFQCDDYCIQLEAPPWWWLDYHLALFVQSSWYVYRWWLSHNSERLPIKKVDDFTHALLFLLFFELYLFKNLSRYHDMPNCAFRICTLHRRDRSRLQVAEVI